MTDSSRKVWQDTPQELARTLGPVTPHVRFRSDLDESDQVCSAKLCIKDVMKHCELLDKLRSIQNNHRKARRPPLHSWPSKRAEDGDKKKRRPYGGWQQLEQHAPVVQQAVDPDSLYRKTLLRWRQERCVPNLQVFNATLLSTCAADPRTPATNHETLYLARLPRFVVTVPS